MPLVSTNPFNGEQIATYAEMSASEVDGILERASVAAVEWKRTPVRERAVVLKRAAQVLQRDANTFARLMAVEMGKPVREGAAEIQKCGLVCDYYAEHGERYLRPERVYNGNPAGSVVFQPLGVMLGIMPWNYPFWQVFRFVAPALIAGNGAVLKHASNVTGCALAIEDVLSRAGVPPGLFRTLRISSASVRSIIAHPTIQGVALTGSTEAGMAVGRLAGKALKKTVLELGGSDPYLVLADADVPAAAAACAKSRLLNSGQSCVAAKRFIVIDSILPDFEACLREELARPLLGDPLDDRTDLGPLVHARSCAEIHGQVRASIERGARCLLGGTDPAPGSSLYSPTLLTDVRPGMPAYEEEIFGPVASIIAVPDEREAVRVANDTVFGLGAAVFTRDIEKGYRLAADELQAGTCAVNDYVKSDPRLPFGGIKGSGHGRELSHYGLREFVNIKSITVSVPTPA